MLMPMAILAIIALLLPFKEPQELDENGDPVAPAGGQSRRTAAPRSPARGRHSGAPGRLPLPGGKLPDWFTRETCTRLVAGGLALALVGAVMALMGYGRPLYRTTTA